MYLKGIKAALAALVLFCATPAHAQAVGGSLAYTSPGKNQYLTGEHIDITDGGKGDLFVAAPTVTLKDKKLEGSAFIAGWKVFVKAPIGRDLHVIGGNVTVRDTAIDGDMTIAGRSVLIGKGVTANGAAVLTGEEVEVNGTLAHGGHLLAKRVRIGGVIDGNLVVDAQELEVVPGALVNGNIIYKGDGKLRLDAGAKVTGHLSREASSFAGLQKKEKKWRAIGKLGSSLVLLSWLVFAGLLGIMFSPAKMRAGALHVGRMPLKSGLFGLGLMVFVPAVAVVLMFSVVGMPFAISLFASYPLMMLIGFAIGVLSLSGFLCKLLGKRLPKERYRLAGLYLLAVVVLLLAGLVPVVGWLLWVLVMLPGVGAVGWLRFRMMKATMAVGKDEA